jgi:hypothetical protein
MWYGLGGMDWVEWIGWNGLGGMEIRWNVFGWMVGKLLGDTKITKNWYKA